MPSVQLHQAVKHATKDSILFQPLILAVQTATMASILILLKKDAILVKDSVISVFRLILAINAVIKLCYLIQPTNAIHFALPDSIIMSV